MILQAPRKANNTFHFRKYTKKIKLFITAFNRYNTDFDNAKTTAFLSWFLIVAAKQSFYPPSLPQSANCCNPFSPAEILAR
ncbi:hypothetical protein Gferi_24910 [Geosporobacter ferrireducens]|uniref:Uncharacterized protein n=1 Tax=Geosporobacter ferrireducens TaxID=1424294 RepID=A0A1D8GNR2_9FIRM|nr:hypothetical protein Gferi_24910 [Geosporobacter ferrireducens]